VQISAQEFGNEVAAGPVNNAGAGRAERAGWPYISSRGEMKMSLSEMTCRMSASQNLHASICMYVCMYVCMYAANVCGGICVLCVWSCVCTRRGEGFGERELTFSCFKCFRSFSSRYVLLDKTGVLKGFMIFLTATF